MVIHRGIQETVFATAAVGVQGCVHTIIHQPYGVYRHERGQPVIGWKGVHAGGQFPVENDRPFRLECSRRWQGGCPSSP